MYIGASDMHELVGVEYLGNGQYILKKSLSDFFSLTSHVKNRYGKDAPSLDYEIFRHRLRGD